MCSFDPFFVNGIWVKSDSVAKEVTSSIKGEYVVLIICLLILIAVLVFLIRNIIKIFQHKYKNKRKSLIFKSIGQFLLFLILIPISFLAILIASSSNMCSFPLPYISNEDFVTQVDAPGNFYKQAFFEDKATLDISKSSYVFECNNEQCHSSFDFKNGNKTITSKVASRRPTSVIFYTCNDSAIVYIYASDRQGISNSFNSPSSFIPEHCFNEQEVFNLGSLGSSPIPAKYQNPELCQQITNDYQQYECMRSMALTKGSTDLCYKLEGADRRSTCVDYVDCYLNRPLVNVSEINYNESFLINSEACASRTLIETICRDPDYPDKILTPTDVWGSDFIADKPTPAITRNTVDENGTNHVKIFTCNLKDIATFKTDRNGHAVLKKEGIRLNFRYNLFSISSYDTKEISVR